MNKLLIVVVVCMALLLGVVAMGFYSQSKLADASFRAYQQQVAAAAQQAYTSAGKEEGNEALARFEKEKNALMSENKNLQEELNRIKSNPVAQVNTEAWKAVIARLEAENARLQESLVSLGAQVQVLQDDNAVLEPITARIKEIMRMADSIEPQAGKRKQIEAQLQNIGKELNMLDVHISKMLIAGAAAGSSLTAREQALQERETKAAALVQQNQELQTAVRVQQDTINSLNTRLQHTGAQTENTVSVQQQHAQDIAAQAGELERLRKEYAVLQNTAGDTQLSLRQATEKITQIEKEKQAIIFAKEEIEKKFGPTSNRIKELEQELAKTKQAAVQAADEAAQRKKRLTEFEAELAKRADKIVSLQAALDEKNNSLLELTVKLQEQLKEAVALREAVVKLRMESTGLKAELRTREEELTALKTEISRIADINTQFKGYVERINKFISVDATGASAPQMPFVKPVRGAHSDGGAGDARKNVHVEIDSVEAKE